MGFVYKFFQIILLIFNAFYFLIGLASILSAITLNLNTNVFNELIKDFYNYEYKLFVYGLILYGFCLLLVGLMACYGILKKSRFLLIVYFILLFLIFAFQFICCLCIYLKSNDYLADFLVKFNSIIRYEYNKSQFYAHAVNYIQHTLQCCGLKTPLDWLDSAYVHPKYYETKQATNSTPKLITNSNADNMYKIPSSCCVNELESSSQCVTSNKIHEIGCESLLKLVFKKYENQLVWILSFLTILQLILLLLSLYLMCISLIKHKKEKKKRPSLSSTSSVYSSSHDSISTSDLSLPEMNRKVNYNYRNRQQQQYPPQRVYYQHQQQQPEFATSHFL